MLNDNVIALNSGMPHPFSLSQDEKPCSTLLLQGALAPLLGARHRQSHMRAPSHVRGKHRTDATQTTKNVFFSMTAHTRPTHTAEAGESRAA